MLAFIINEQARINTGIGYERWQFAFWGREKAISGSGNSDIGVTIHEVFHHSKYCPVRYFNALVFVQAIKPI